MQKKRSSRSGLRKGTERPSLVDTWNLMKLPVDNTSACSKNLGLRYAASSGLAQSPAPSSQLPPPVFEELPEPEVFEELPRPEPSLSLEVSASQMGDLIPIWEV